MPRRRKQRFRYLRGLKGGAFAQNTRIGQLARADRSAISEFASSSSPSWSSNRAVLETDANMVSRTKKRALDPLLVPALLALATPSIC
eukprot:scaffold110501_cov33-Phaeocystis_antarctica.AAC.2